MAKVGRPSRADLAARAAAQAAAEAQKIASELPQETTEAPEPSGQEPTREMDSPEPQRVAPRNEARRKALQEVEDRDIHTKKGLGIELGLTDEETPPKKDESVSPDLPPPTPESMLQGGKFSQPGVKVKVDGEEFEVSQQEVDEYGGIRGYQIAKAAENRLQKANQALAEVRKIQEESKKQVPAQTPDEFIKSKIEVMRWGSQEEAAQALKEMIAAQLPKPQDEERLIARAADKMRHDDAVRQFDKEFTDIGASQMHLKLVKALRDESLQKNGHPGDWNTFYRSLGNQVRSILPKQSQPGKVEVAGGTTQPQADKEARKASVTQLVSPPQAAARAVTPEEPPPPTREDVFKQMRKKRGLPTG